MFFSLLSMRQLTLKTIFPPPKEEEKKQTKRVFFKLLPYLTFITLYIQLEDDSVGGDGGEDILEQDSRHSSLNLQPSHPLHLLLPQHSGITRVGWVRGVRVEKASFITKYEE